MVRRIVCAYGLLGFLVLNTHAFAGDVRDNLPAKPASYHKAILVSAKEGDLGKAHSAMEKLKPLADYLDQRYGDNLGTLKADRAESVMHWSVTMIYQSISMSYDESAEDLSNQEEVRKKVRYAMEEFSEVESLLKEKDHKAAIEIRKAIQQSMSMTGDKEKFRQNAQQIKESYARAFPDAVAATLKSSLQSIQKDRKFKAIAESNFQAIHAVVSAKDSGKADVIEKGLSGEPLAVSAAMDALEALFPAGKD